MSKFRQALGLVAAMSAICLVVGCGSRIEGTAVAAVERFDDPTELIVHAVQTMFGWHPATDTSSADAFARAAPYLEGELAAQTRVGPDEGGAQWKKWADAKATTSVEAALASDEHPPDTADTVHRVVLVTVTIVAPGDKPLETIEFTAWTTARKTVQGWLVNEIEV
jgi:hypothetical protein